VLGTKTVETSPFSKQKPYSAPRLIGGVAGSVQKSSFFFPSAIGQLRCVRHGMYLALITASRKIHLSTVPTCLICIIACQKKFIPGSASEISFPSLPIPIHPRTFYIQADRPIVFHTLVACCSGIMYRTPAPALSEIIDIDRRIYMPPSRQHLIALTQYRSLIHPHRILYVTHVSCEPNFRRAICPGCPHCFALLYVRAYTQPLIRYMYNVVQIRPVLVAPWNCKRRKKVPLELTSYQQRNPPTSIFGQSENKE